MRGFTQRESKVMHDVTNRISSMRSPVQRTQIIMHISQLVDILNLGDTSSAYEDELVAEIDALTNQARGLSAASKKKNKNTTRKASDKVFRTLS